MTERPPARGDANRPTCLLAGSRARLAAALADLAVPEPSRLGDWQRSLFSALLEDVVRGVEDELRAAVALSLAGPRREALHAALGSAHVAIAFPVLQRSSTFPPKPLASILIRRIEEHRLYLQDAGQAGLLLELAGGSDAAMAGDAMAVLIAQSARLDTRREPILAQAELPAEVQHDLVWTIGAAVRHYIVRYHDVPAAQVDEAIARGVQAMLGRYDEAASIDALCLRLARRLDDAGTLKGAGIGRMLTDGGLPLFLACLAVRTGLDAAAVWEIMFDPQGRGTVFLLRAADAQRDAAGSVLLKFYDHAEERVGPLLDLFDTTDEAEAKAELALWRFDAAYRTAVAALDEAA